MGDVRCACGLALPTQLAALPPDSRYTCRCGRSHSVTVDTARLLARVDEQEKAIALLNQSVIGLIDRVERLEGMLQP